MVGVNQTPDGDPLGAPQFDASPGSQVIDAGDVESMDFPVTRRGLDPGEVRSRLQAAASEIRRLQRLCDELTGRLTEVFQAPQTSDARRVTEMLEVEVGGVLEAAHEAATSTIQRAESEAASITGEARAAAESVLADATAQSSELVEAARLEADEIIEESRNHGREMVHEAQTVRERILRDLARKRQMGRTQIEQLRAGRDRLLEALSTVQANLDAAVEDLVTSVPEARSAATRAGLRVSSEPPQTVDDLEAELEAARLVDHPLVSDSPLPGPIGDTFTTGEMEALDHLDALGASGGETDADGVGGAGVAEADEPEPVRAEAELEADPVQPADPADAEDPVQPEEPADAEDPVQPEDALQPADAVQPAQPEEHADAEDPVQADHGSEVETGVEFETEFEVETEVAVETGVAVETEAEAERGAVAAAGRVEPAGSAGDVFARLRRLRASAEPRPEAVPQTPGQADSVAETESAPQIESVAETVQESEDEGTDAHGGSGESSEPAQSEDPPADPNEEIRERAAVAAAKAMKRVLVEEQGSLLDGIRRSGAAAVTSLEDEEIHNSCYDRAAIPALREQCITLGGTSELDLEPALANIHVIALEPVRRRLADVAEQFDSEEELSDAVRAVYREARSRHLNEAAAAASVAVEGLVKIDRAHNGKANRTVRWVVDPGGACGADCADNALAGEVAAGEEFPTGDRFPPAHPGCRCRIEVA